MLNYKPRSKPSKFIIQHSVFDIINDETCEV
jgi:hypothetical protein